MRRRSPASGASAVSGGSTLSPSPLSASPVWFPGESEVGGGAGEGAGVEPGSPVAALATSGSLAEPARAGASPGSPCSTLSPSPLSASPVWVGGIEGASTVQAAGPGGAACFSPHSPASPSSPTWHGDIGSSLGAAAALESEEARAEVAQPGSRVAGLDAGATGLDAGALRPRTAEDERARLTRAFLTRPNPSKELLVKERMTELYNALLFKERRVRQLEKQMRDLEIKRPDLGVAEARPVRHVDKRMSEQDTVESDLHRHYRDLLRILEAPPPAPLPRQPPQHLPQQHEAARLAAENAQLRAELLNAVKSTYAAVSRLRKEKEALASERAKLRELSRVSHEASELAERVRGRDAELRFLRSQVGELSASLASRDMSLIMQARKLEQATLRESKLRDAFQSVALAAGMAPREAELAAAEGAARYVGDANLLAEAALDAGAAAPPASAAPAPAPAPAPAVESSRASKPPRRLPSASLPHDEPAYRAAFFAMAHDHMASSKLVERAKVRVRSLEDQLMAKDKALRLVIKRSQKRRALMPDAIAASVSASAPPAAARLLKGLAPLAGVAPVAGARSAGRGDALRAVGSGSSSSNSNNGGGSSSSSNNNNNSSSNNGGSSDS
jgi:hypothetical protein